VTLNVLAWSAIAFFFLLVSDLGESVFESEEKLAAGGEARGYAW
jgi:hypothetical protein